MSKTHFRKSKANSSMRAVVGAVVLAASSIASAQGIPVIDATSLTHQIEQVIAWGKQNGQMIESINEARALVTRATSAYSAITGSRGLSSLLNGIIDQAARRYMPESADGITALAGGALTGYSALQSSIASLRSTVSTMPSTTFDAGSVARNLFDQRVNALATQKALGQSAYNAAAKRTADIESLIAASSGAVDPKGIAELQSRLAAEQALMQNEGIRLQALANMQASEERVQAQKAREMVAGWSKGPMPAFSF